MSSDLEEKINDIHDIVIGIKADMSADKKICASQHLRIDSDMVRLDKTLNGNGKAGLVQRFDKLETRIVAWTTTAIVVVQVLSPYIKELIHK